MRIIRRKANIKEEEAIMVRGSRCSNDGCSQEINPVLINSNIYTICQIQSIHFIIQYNSKLYKFGGCKMSWKKNICEKIKEINGN